MLRTFHRFASLAAALALAACSGGSNGSTGGTASSSGSAGSSSSSSSGSTSGSSGSSSASSTGSSGSSSSSSSGSTGSASYHGYLAVDRLESADGGMQHLAFALVLTQPQPSSTACLGTPAGDCCYYAPDYDAGPEPQYAQVSAGALTISDLTQDAGLGQLSYDATYGYMNTGWVTPEWSTGDLIDFRGTGGVASAFDVSAPAPAIIGGSGLFDGQPHAISTSADLAVSWTPDGVSTAVELELLAENPTNGYGVDGEIICRAPDAQGQLTVPASLLAHFPAGDIASNCGLARLSHLDATAGNTAVHYDVQSSRTCDWTFQ